MFTGVNERSLRSAGYQKLGENIGETPLSRSFLGNNLGNIQVVLESHIAGEVLWWHLCFPSKGGEFDSRRPLQVVFERCLWVVSSHGAHLAVYAFLLRLFLGFSSVNRSAVSAEYREKRFERISDSVDAGLRPYAARTSRSSFWCASTRSRGIASGS